MMPPCDFPIPLCGLHAGRFHRTSHGLPIHAALVSCTSCTDFRLRRSERHGRICRLRTRIEPVEYRVRNHRPCRVPNDSVVEPHPLRCRPDGLRRPAEYAAVESELGSMRSAVRLCEAIGTQRGDRRERVLCERSAGNDLEPTDECGMATSLAPSAGPRDPDGLPRSTRFAVRSRPGSGRRRAGGCRRHGGPCRCPSLPVRSPAAALRARLVPRCRPVPRRHPATRPVYRATLRERCRSPEPMHR